MRGRNLRCELGETVLAHLDAGVRRTLSEEVLRRAVGVPEIDVGAHLFDDAVEPLRGARVVAAVLDWGVLCLSHFAMVRPSPYGCLKAPSFPPETVRFVLGSPRRTRETGGTRGEGTTQAMPDLHNIRLPAGWYPDPSGAEHRRWWDGTTWTQHTAPFQRPAPVYDVDDLAESRVTTTTGVEVVPAPRRIRTAARLGRGLAALAHKLPFGLPARDDANDDEPDAAPPPSPPATGRHAR